MERQLRVIVYMKRGGMLTASSLKEIRKRARQLARTTQPSMNTLEVMETYRVMKQVGDPMTRWDYYQTWAQGLLR